MDRPPRAFRAVASPLEGRLLLTTAPPPLPAPAPLPVAQFVGTLKYDGTVDDAGHRTGYRSKFVTQQAGTATILLEAFNRATYPVSPMPSPVTVQVTTDPSSPAVGVNVGAVNQTVTFAA